MALFNSEVPIYSNIYENENINRTQLTDEEYKEFLDAVHSKNYNDMENELIDITAELKQRTID